MHEIILRPTSLESRSSTGRDHELISATALREAPGAQVESPSNGTQQSKPGVDKCWGRAVIACGATLFASAVHSTSGFFYVAFMREFGVNREAASWPTSVFDALDEAGGAIAWAFLRGFAVSTIGMIGGVLVWCGIIASVFAPDMMWMSLTFGFVQGAGSGFVSMAVTVILMMYFDKYRGVATGIRCAGYSLSSLIYPPIFTFLSQVLPFRQLILIFAGITLHVTPLLLALKEPPWTRKSADVTNSRRRANSMKRIESERIRQQSEQNIKGSTKTKENRVFSERETAMDLNRKLDRAAKSIVCYSIGKRSVEGENSVTAREACNEVTARKSLKENNCVSKVPNRAEYKCVEGLMMNSTCRVNNGILDENSKTPRWLTLKTKNERSDISIILDSPTKVISHSPVDSELPFWEVHERQRTIGCSVAEENDGHRKGSPTTSRLPEDQCNGDQGKASFDVLTSRNERKKERPTQGETASFVQLILTPTFWAVVLGAVLAEFTDCTFLVTLVDSGLDRGATRLQADLTITCSAPSQLVGRAVLPLLADIGFVSRTTLACVCYFLFAAAVMVLAVTRSFVTYAPCAAAATIVLGCLTTMKHVVTADYFGVGAVPTAWAATGTILLPMVLSTPFILGFFRDKQGSYNNLYYSLGSAHLLMGIVFLLLRCLALKREKN